MRKLRIVGSILVASMACGAVWASAASAQQGVLTSDGPVTLTGTELSVGSLTQDKGDRQVTCPGSTFTGHAFAETPHGFLLSGEKTVTITPHYKQENCRAHIETIFGKITRTATVTMNGCDYVFHLGETTPAENEAGTYGVTADLVCPPEKTVEVDVFCSGCEHKAQNHICTTTVHSQSGLKGLHATDQGNGHVRVHGTLVEIKSTSHGSLCEGNSVTDELHVDITVSGHNAEGNPTDISLSH